MTAKIGIIGGSGFYDIEGMDKIKGVKVDTPFGDPSDEYITGMLEGQEMVFLARHGKGHRLAPEEINYPANIYGMKKLGVERIISVSACGSLRKELKPTDIVVPDQLVDRTNQARTMTFFGNGIVAHVGFAEPYCHELSKVLFDAGEKSGAVMHMGGTYINMEGPQFSTRAESNLYRQWGMDIIGMTNLGEAKLAREAEICYAALACVTDYDCWYEEETGETVSVEMVIRNLLKNVSNAKAILKETLPRLKGKRHCPCSSALKDAIITSHDAISEATRNRLKLIVGKYIK